MHQTLPHIFLFLTAAGAGIAPLSGFSQSNTEESSLPSGIWELREEYQNRQGKQSVVWSFEILDDGQATIMGVGRRVASKGKTIRDRGVAILFVDKHEDGGLTGSFIEAYGNGEQIELGLNVGMTENRKELRLEAIDSAGEIVSKMTAKWLSKPKRVPLESGSWMVREVVSPDNGSWDIEWRYQIKENGGTITGRGNKSLVNGRKCYPGERKTYCEISLARSSQHPDSAAGKAVETNHTGKKMHAEYRGWVSPSGRTFFMMSYEKDRLAAMIVGRRAGS